MKSIYYEPNLNEEQDNRKWFKNVTLIGEIDEGTSIYIEDYAHTYLKQCGKSDQSYEVCAVLIGEYHKESDQMVVYGVIPVEVNALNKDAKWIDESVLDVIEEERRCYFPKGDYVGWMHTQPGYGIMPTTEEMALHLDMFGEECVLMLMDPIYDIEAFYTCKKKQFEEKKGYCIYYEKNEPMQKYMENHSLMEKKKLGEDDKVVGDFRKLGAERKKEVQLKRKKSLIVNITLASILLTGAFIIGIQSQQKRINTLQKDMVNIHQQYSEIENRIPNNPVELVFASAKVEAEDKPKLKEETSVQTVTEKAVEPAPVLESISQIAYDIHDVKVGESLLSISYNHYKTLGMAKEIASLNNIENNDNIYIGQKLKLPKKEN